MEFETYADVIDAYNANDMGYSSLTDYIKGENIKIKEIEMEPMADLQRSLFENKADGGSVGIEVLFKPKRKNFFMGGPALEGQALSIYTSMKDYGATDQAIADRLSSLGLYDPNASTPPGAGDNIIGSQINQGGGGGEGITELQETFTSLPGDPKNFRMSQLKGLQIIFQQLQRLEKLKKV